MHTRMNRQMRCALIAGALVVVWSQLAMAIDESVTGDLSSLPASPTPVTLVAGNNQLKGSVHGSSDAGDTLSSVPALDPWMIWLTWLLVGTAGFLALNLSARGSLPKPMTD